MTSLIKSPLSSPAASPVRSHVGDAVGMSLYNAGLVDQQLFKFKPQLDGIVRGSQPGAGTFRHEQPGRCWEFDGVNDYVSVPAITTTGNVTVSFWVNTSQSGSGQIIALEANATNHIAVGVYNGRQVLASFNGTNPTGAKETAAIASATWVHVAVTKTDSGIQEIYLNGVASGGGASAMWGSIGGNRIGMSNGGGVPFAGMLFDPKLYSRVLTADEILQLYTLGSNALANDPDCELHYKTDEQHPTKALDSSGNGRDGTLTGHTATVGEFFYEGNDVPFSWQNDKGYGVGFYETNTKSRIGTATFGRASNTNVSLRFKIKTTDAGFVGFTNGSASSNFFFTVDGTTGATHSNAPATGITIDGVAFSGNRLALYAAIADGEEHSVVYSGLDLSDSGWASGLYLGGYNSSGYDFTGMVYDLYLDGVQYGYKIPRDESNKAYDVFGNALQYVGECPRNALLSSNCLTLDGSNDICAVPDQIVSGSEITFAGLVRKHDAGGDGYLINSGNDRLGIMVTRSGSSGNAVAYVVTGVSTYVADSGIAISTDVWTHLAMTWNGSVLKVFVDGIEKASTATSGTATYDNWLTLGSLSNDGVNAPAASAGLDTMSIADLRCYTTALTASEVLYLATKGNSGTVPSVDPVGHWPCSEGKGNVIHDVTPNANHGLLTNANLVDAWAIKQPMLAWNAHYGCSLYEHATLDPIFVPYGVDGNPLTITPPSGYTKTVDLPAGEWHNFCESTVDFTGGVASPGSAGLITDHHPSDALTNPYFQRITSEDSVDVRADRIVRYSETLTGNRLTAAQKYTLDRTL